MPTPKPSLAAHLKERLGSTYDSVAQASASLGVPYERLKKAIRENRFNASDIAVLMPDYEQNDLEEQFEFEYSRKYIGVNNAVRLQLKRSNAHIFIQTLTPFNLIKTAVAATEFQGFLNDLYHNLTDGSAMFLFCSNTAKPVEWSLSDREVLEKICIAINEGGIVIYIFEDKIGDDFELFARALNRIQLSMQTNATSDSHSGFVAVLSVDRCAFCTPHQKFAMLNLTDTEGSLVHQGLTAIDIPESIDGRGQLGVLVLPLVSDFIAGMLMYLNRLILTFSDAEKLPAGFDVSCFPRMSHAQFINRLSTML